MNTATNEQGNFVYAADIACFVASGQKVPGNRAFKFVWRDFPLQQASRLDRRVHEVRKLEHIHLGTRCVGMITSDVYSADCILLDHFSGVASE